MRWFKAWFSQVDYRVSTKHFAYNKMFIIEWHFPKLAQKFGTLCCVRAGQEIPLTLYLCPCLSVYLSRGGNRRDTQRPYEYKIWCDILNLIWSRGWNNQIQVICSLPRQVTCCLVTTLPQQTVSLQYTATAALP